MSYERKSWCMDYLTLQWMILKGLNHGCYKLGVCVVCSIFTRIIHTLKTSRAITRGRLSNQTTYNIKKKGKEVTGAPKVVEKCQDQNSNTRSTKYTPLILIKCQITPIILPLSVNQNLRLCFSKYSFRFNLFVSLSFSLFQKNVSFLLFWQFFDSNYPHNMFKTTRLNGILVILHISLV